MQGPVLDMTELRRVVEDGISDIYSTLALRNNLPSGDEAPEQGLRREEIEARLSNLVAEWLVNNDPKIPHWGLEEIR